jgi:hypothetical protein
MIGCVWVRKFRDFGVDCIALHLSQFMGLLRFIAAYVARYNYEPTQFQVKTKASSLALVLVALNLRGMIFSIMKDHCTTKPHHIKPLKI